MKKKVIRAFMTYDWAVEKITFIKAGEKELLINLMGRKL